MRCGGAVMQPRDGSGLPPYVTGKSQTHPPDPAPCAAVPRYLWHRIYSTPGGGGGVNISSGEKFAIKKGGELFTGEILRVVTSTGTRA